MYKLLTQLSTDFVNAYKDVVTFDRLFQEKLMKVYALSEKTRVDNFYFSGHSYSAKYGSFMRDGEAISEEVYETALTAFRQGKLEDLLEERDATNYLRSTKDTYQTISFYDDIMLTLNSNAKRHARAYATDSSGRYNSCVDEFFYEEVDVIANAIAYLYKVYPRFTDYFVKCELTDESGLILIDYLIKK